MELLRCKARLSVLWLGMAVGTVAAMFLDFVAGEMGGMQIDEVMMVGSALFVLIPMVVALLCLTLSSSTNRWLSFILGIIWVLYFIFDTVSHATAGVVVPIAIWLMIAAGLVISAYIVYFAWKLPKQEA